MQTSFVMICGPMGSGKSTELHRLVKRARVARLRVKVVNHVFDQERLDSSEGKTRTHDLQEMEAVMLPSLDELTEESLREVDIVAIDEAQFFDDLFFHVQRLLQLGRTVYTAGLDATWQGRPFNKYTDLLALATDVLKLKAVCMRCHQPTATFSHRLLRHDTDVCVGGLDKYEPRCLACFPPVFASLDKKALQ